MVDEGGRLGSTTAVDVEDGVGAGAIEAEAGDASDICEDKPKGQLGRRTLWRGIPQLMKMERGDKTVLTMMIKSSDRGKFDGMSMWSGPGLTTTCLRCPRASTRARLGICYVTSRCK